MPLTDVQIRKAQPRETRYRLSDGDCLSLLVLPTGVKSWRFRRTVDGHEQVKTLGQYPEMSLVAARRLRDELVGTPIAAPIVPAPALRQAARDWHTTQKPVWKAHHATEVWRDIERELLPTLGDRWLNTISKPDILAVLRPIQERGAVDLAHRLRQRLSEIFTFAIHSGATDLVNPVIGLERVLSKVVRQSHRPAAVSLDGARRALAAFDDISAHPVNRLAVRLLALTAVRPGELRHGRWAEIDDLDGAAPLWRIPALRMKHIMVRAAAAQDHLVPLSRQAVATLRVLHQLTGKTGLMFHSPLARGKPITEDGLIQIHLRAGLAGQQVPHGWRATFSTIMNELYPPDYHIIELMLAHRPKDQVAASYNRATHMERRRDLAQIWADLLVVDLAAPATLLDLPRRG